MTIALEPTTMHTSAKGVIDLRTIIIDERYRSDDEETREFIEEELAPSIADFGLIEPIVVEFGEPRTGLNFMREEITSAAKLVTGWSRLISFSILNRFDIPYCQREALEEDERFALELEENLRRRDPSYIDTVKAIARVHTLKKARAASDSERWGVRQTGKLLHVAMGAVTEVLQVAKLIEAGDEEAKALKTQMEARELLARREEKKIEKELHRRQADKHKIDKAKAKPESAPAPASGSKIEPKKDDEPIVHHVDLSSRVLNIDCHTWFDQREAESIDLIYTDIPYGIDMENLTGDGVVFRDIKTTAKEHDIDENLEQMPKFLAGAWKVLKDRSYLAFWMDLKHWEKLVVWGEEIGFSVMPYPLLWLKPTSGCNAAHCWWTKCHETVMIMRKGAAGLKHAMSTNFLLCNGKAERDTFGHQFSKPIEFSIQMVLEPILTPGMTVLDPYAGCGSVIAPAITLGADIIALEKSPEHLPKLLSNLKTVYSQTLKGKVSFS